MVKRASVFRAAIAFLSLVLLAFAAWQVLRRGDADWVTLRARAEVRVWAQAGKLPFSERWARDVEDLRAGLRLTPGNASLYESLAQAYALSAGLLNSRSGRDIHHEFSLLHYRVATTLRPTWPYAWIGVAAELLSLGRVNEELIGALVRAMRYGPWEPPVQLGASAVGLALWDRLDPVLREQVRQNWRRTAVRQADALAKIALVQRRKDILCAEHIPGMDARLKCAAR